jgi:hypothetical protein
MAERPCSELDASMVHPFLTIEITNVTQAREVNGTGDLSNTNEQ